jgi:hypothetical protein
MQKRTFLLAALTALTAIAGPASAAERIPIADEGGIGATWTLVPGTQLMPPYPEAYASEPEEVCLVIGYLVNADGHTSDFALLKSWTSGTNSRARTDFWETFGDLASRALAQWKYQPATTGAAEPVYTAATFVFGTPGAVPSTRTHCEIAELATRLAELRYDARASRMMTGGVFSRLEIDPYVEERLRRRMLIQHENASEQAMASSIQDQRLVADHAQLHDAE